MRFASVLRTTAVGLALSACALLLGLSRAHDALPGDTFQVARVTVAVAAAAGAETPQGRKLPEPRDSRSDAPHWLAVLPRIADADPGLGPVCGGPSTVTLHDGRSTGTPGCRGPPTS
ncbi:hypothetical protein AB0K00_50225 [Dactylosporangium sp. NPDC049525]|uniref:hypothetical protein n=1 Tax=Dactylosporangium sp. NPDC049525 TaxID=3154730 RepID=UPI003423F9EB